MMTYLAIRNLCEKVTKICDKFLMLTIATLLSKPRVNKR